MGREGNSDGMFSGHSTRHKFPESKYRLCQYQSLRFMLGSDKNRNDKCGVVRSCRVYSLTIAKSRARGTLMHTLCGNQSLNKVVLPAPISPCKAQTEQTVCRLLIVLLPLRGFHVEKKRSLDRLRLLQAFFEDSEIIGDYHRFQAHATMLKGGLCKVT